VVFRAVLVAQLGTPEAAIETTVFPDSRGVRALADLFT
jgi:uncharacterized protein (DUF1501 family)